MMNETIDMPVVVNQPNNGAALDNKRKGSILSTMQEGQPSMIEPSPGDPNLNTFSFPPQLRQLASVERVLIKQKKELLEIIASFETENKYEILNERNELLYKVKESSDCCSRQCCGPLRPMVVNISEPDGNPVMSLDRPLSCQGFCCPCCLQSMAIMHASGGSIGWIEEKWNLYPTLHVMNEDGKTEFIIKGPFCQCSWTCGDVEFPIFASDGVSECGRISKKWRGFLHEYFTDADIFGVQFPPGISPISKALLVGATFLVDYMYFEQSQNRHNY